MHNDVLYEIPYVFKLFKFAEKLIDAIINYFRDEEKNKKYVIQISKNFNNYLQRKGYTLFIQVERIIIFN